MPTNEGQKSSTQSSAEYASQGSTQQTVDDSPEERVKNLKQKLQTDQSTLDSLKKSTDKLQADITELEKLVDGLTSVIDEYNKAYETLQEEKVKIQRDYDDMKKSIQATVEKADVEKVNSAKRSIDEQINAWNGDINKLEGDGPDSLLSAEAKYKETLKNQKVASEAFDKEKSLLKRISENFKKIKEFKKLADEEDSKGNKRKMYFYFIQLEELLNLTIPWIKEKNQYKTDLNDKWSSLYVAKNSVREAERTVNERKVALENLKKNVEAATKNFAADILDKIE